MDIEPLRLVAFLHVLLFVYWLGGDLGVFLCGSRLTREDLSLEERLRVREIGAALDMGPRTALPLMIPVGFTLAQPYGAPVTGTWLALLWLAALVWVGLIWAVHYRQGEPLGRALLKVDYAIRYTALVAIGAFGLYCLINGRPIAAHWLVAKILLYAVIIANGLWIRRAAARFPPAIQKVRAGGEERVVGERMLKLSRAAVRVPVLLIWFLVAVMGFLGVVKPF